MTKLRPISYIAVDRLRHELVHHGGDGWVEDERYEEEESEDTDNAESSQEHGGVVLDFF